MKCQVFEIFFGGARGGGKTDGVLGEFGAHASRYGKDAIGLMVRRTRAELVETIERSRAIYRPLKWEFNEQAPDGARLRFAYLERDAEADLYQGLGASERVGMRMSSRNSSSCDHWGTPDRKPTRSATWMLMTNCLPSDDWSK